MGEIGNEPCRIGRQEEELKIMTGKHRRIEDDEKPASRRYENISFPQRPNASPKGWGDAYVGEENRGQHDRPLRGRGRL